MTFFEVFRLFKFVNKICCTENYLELHETNYIYENPINQGLIWNLFWYMSSREILHDMHLNLARSKFWDFFTSYGERLLRLLQFCSAGQQWAAGLTCCCRCTDLWFQLQPLYTQRYSSFGRFWAGSAENALKTHRERIHRAKVLLRS